MFLYIQQNPTLLPTVHSIFTDLVGKKSINYITWNS